MFMQKLNLPSIGLQYIRFKPKLNITTSIFYRLNASYIVLLPEVPEETSENNSLLDMTRLPEFKEITADKCYTAVGKRCLDYETGVWALEDKIKEGSQPNNYDNIINELDKLDAPLTYAWNTSKTLYSVKNDEISTSNYLKIHERARRARVHKFQSRPIYEACKEIYLKDTSLNEAQKRVLRKFLLEARLNGVELSEHHSKVLTSTLKKLDEHKSLYMRKLEEASKRFSYRIIDHEIVRDLPDDLLKNMSHSSTDYLRGPWIVTHHPLVYHKFLEHCPHKDLRWNAWKAYVMRSSVYLVSELNNGLHVEEIRAARHEQANHLGFQTFADMSMETKMAGSVDNVFTMITSLFVKAKEKQDEEMTSLKEFAETRGFEGEMIDCDVPYWRRKQRIHISNLTETNLNTFFPFHHVWDQLLSLCSNLFGIYFEEVPQGKVQTWHPDVRFYNVLNSEGKIMSSFYLDPYKRPNQKLHTSTNSAWMLSIKTRSDVVNSSPLASLIFNFELPSTQTHDVSLLTFNDVQTLFKKFGHALHHLLSTIPYGQASGLTNIEWDAVEVSENVLLNWLYEPSVLEKISKNPETGLSLDQAGIQSIISSRSHLAAFDLCNELFISHFDMKLHSEQTFWVEILKELWPLYMPFPLIKEHTLPTWFSPIMSDVWAASYYSHVWSKMLAADAFRAFKECNSEEVGNVGKRYRETFLSLGGGCHPAEVFRTFRGRDPMPEALHKVLGI